MNAKIHTFALLGGMLLGGCISSEDQIDSIDGIDELDEPTDPTEPTAEPANELAAPTEESVPAMSSIIPAECIGAPIVAILENPQSACSNRELPPGWVWKPMFQNGSPDVAALGMPVPAEFQKFCLFEYVGQAKLSSPEQYNPIINYINQHPYLDETTAMADCMGFQEQGALTDPEVIKMLHESFMMSIDAADESDLHDTAGFQQPVRVEVLDSVSQTAIDNGITPHNMHGIYMSSLISEIACPGGDHACTSQIHHMLAMPRADYQYPDWTVGEDYASKVDLAIQIYAAVQQWRKDKLNHDPKATDRLVINISLGYQRVNQGIDDFNRGPQASLKAALDFASCHGALVFAASGNVRDENCPQNEDGPLAPAAFEGILAPNEDECHQLGFTPDWEHEFPIFTSEPRPLVYAISAVDHFDEPVANARPGSVTTLSANGDYAVGANMTMPLTGSSVSTAVASATAKLLWSYNPRLRPDEVFYSMYKSGWNTGRAADFGVWPGAHNRRISVCSALSYMCSSEDPHECPHLGCFPTAPASDGNLGGYFSVVDDILSDPSTVIKVDTSSNSSPVCSQQQPTELVTPQPELPVCGVCGADIKASTASANDKLNMSVDISYKGHITGATLLLDNGNAVSTVVNMSPSTIGNLNDTSVNVVQVFFNAPSGTKAATLNFTLTTGAQANPVVLRFL